MSAPQRRIHLTPDEYLAREIAAPRKHEYIAGEIYAMAGASERHNRIAGNAFFALRSRTGGSACAAYIADMRLRVESANAFYYPHVMLCCEPTDAHPQYKTSPCAVIEVSSPSTVTIDEREKLVAYKTIPSLRYYLRADSESARVTWHERVDANDWQTGTLEGDEILHLECSDRRFALSLPELYDGTGLLAS